MSLRLIEMIIPSSYAGQAEEFVQAEKIVDFWKEEIDEGRIRIKILIPTENTEAVMDILENRFKLIEGFRMILFSIEATVPRPEKKEPQVSLPGGNSAEVDPEKKRRRIAREELYSDIEKMSRLSWVFGVLIVLATIVAAIGMLRNHVVYIIGAMVIAPSLGPNVALALGTTLGDVVLSRQALKTIVVGTIVTLFFSVLVGVAITVDLESKELLSRTQVNFDDIILALSAGCAAVLSLTSGLFSALIGVMVAVALLPPLVSCGMLAGAGHWDLALGALLLFLVNFICINLSGIVTFLAQGIRPLTWWESTQAKKATRKAIMLWTGLLTALAILIYLSQS